MAALLIMSEERGKGSPIEISLPEEMSKRSHVSSSVSVKSHQSKFDVPNFSEETPSSSKSVDSDNQTCGNFKDNLLCIFQDLENKIITFLKNELEKFKNILQNKNIQYFVKDFNENRCSIKEAALDLALYFLRYMKQDKAANTLEDELIFIHQLKCNLKKKYQCVFEGIAKHGDSILLNNIYTDLYITQGGSQQVNTEHEVRQIEVTSRHHESQEIAIECKNMFEAPEQDKEIRSVLTKGVAGIGKSVSVQKFVLDWAEGKENQDISFIFPLPFREMNLKEKDKQSLMGLIGQFFPEIKALNLTRRNNFKVLFILDGLDEFRLPLNFKGNETWRDVSSPTSLDVLLTNLIKGNLLPSALIWITTRPAAASKIPPDCIDRVTEIRGFSDAQKKEYFKKRFTDKNMGNEIIDHIKKSKSLFIMCHIPVFCWISATVLQNILEEKRNNELKNDQTNDTSKTLQESITEDTPKTLTQMYAHFLRFQIQQSSRKYDGEYRPDVSWDKEDIMSLGKLAFQQLERNNLVFYESDLEACGIDVYKASVYSGMCTQIFKEETGIILGTMYCFVHLSFQEFIAALYAHLFLDINKKSVFVHESTEQENKNEIMIDFLKTAVDKALKSDNGHLDLFLRFLLGLSLQSNQQLLRGLLTQQDSNDQSNKEIVQYIKQKFEDNLSPERSINLFYCLNELNDQTLVKEIQSHLSKGSLSSVDLSPAQWSAVAFVLLTSEEELEEFELQNFQKSDECVIRLSAVIKTSKRALLNNCGLTDKSCPALATVLGIDSNLKELNMNNNNLQDSGVKQLCIGLESKMCKLEILRLSKCELTEESCSVLAAILSLDSSSLKEIDLSDNNLLNSGVKLLSDGLKNNCKLEKLRLSDCGITEEGYKTLASALRSNPSHLIELDLTGNDPGQSGVKDLNDLLQDGFYKLKNIRFLKSPAAEEACEYLSKVLGISPLLLQELDLSEDKLGDLDAEQLSALLMDSHSKLEKMKLNNCQLTKKSCSVLATVLSSKTILKEMDLNNSHLLDSGVKEICEGLKSPMCKLKILKLSKCMLTEESCSALATVLSSDSSSLNVLDLSKNNLLDSGVKLLSDGLRNNCKLEKLRLSDCSVTEEGYKALASALRSNSSRLIELDLTGNDPGQSGVKDLNDLLQDPNCKLKKLRFLSPVADEACNYVTEIRGENPLLLRVLNLSEHKLGDTRVKQLAALLENNHCKLSTLWLNNSNITEEGCSALASAFNLNPLNLKELDLSGNKLGNSGMKKICHLLENPQCRLEKLKLSKCTLTEESCSALAAVLISDSSSLKELDLSNNNMLDSGVMLLSDGLKNNCKLEKLRLSDCSVTEEGYKTLASALRSNSSHLIELDLTGNDPGQSGVKELNDLLQDGCYKLKTIRFLKSPAAEEACEYLSNVLGISPLLLQELDLSEDKLGDLDGEKLSALLVDSHSKLEKMKLNNCQLTEKSCSVLATVLSSKTILKELDLNNSHLLDSGVKEICEGLKNPVCKLKILKLSNCSITEGGYNAVASALRSNPSHLIELDLTGNDPGQSGVNVLNDLLLDPNCKLKTLMLLQTPAAKKTCQYLTRVLHNNPLFLRELNLSGHKVRDSKVKHIAVLLQDKHCKLAKLQLRNCNLPEESCSALATILRTNTCLKELDISNNNLQDSGVKKLQNGLENTNCTLEKLRLSSCSVTEEGYKALASALRSNPLHLIELDLTGNDPGQSGVKELNDLLQDPNCKLKKLRFLSPDAVEACHYVTEIQGENPLLLRVLNLSECELGDTRVKQLAALLRDKHCKLSTLQLNNNKITEEGCSALASAFNLNPSNLKELDLSGNKLGNSGMKKICRLLENPQCRLEKLKLCRCNVTEKQYLNLTSALCLNLSHLRELDLSGNKLKNKGVKHLCDILNHSHCKLERLSLRDSEMTDEGCSALTSALKSNPSHLRELNLSRNKLGNSGVKNLAVLLRNPQCKLEILVLCGCGITEKQCLILALGLRSNISYLRELDLSGNKIKNTGVILLCDVLNHSHCKLQRLRLRGCDVTNKGFCALTSALKSNPSHLRELNLSGNALGDSGVENLGDLLSNSRCKLEKLDLCGCNIKEEQSLSLILSLCLNPSQMIELDLSGNKTKNTGVEMICHVLKDSDCKLQRLGLNDCGITDVACLAQSLATKQVLQLRELDLSNNNIGDSKEQLIGVLQDSNCTLNLDGKHCFTSWSKPQEPEKSTEDVRSSEKPHYSTVSMRFGESASHLVAVTKATSLKAERRDWEDVFHVSMIKRGRHKAALRTRKMEQRRKKNRIRTQSKWTSMTQDYPVHLSTPVHLLLVNLLHPVHF
ncbi:uncharacterized protein LOC127513157 isoform X2 [Ctenopharyngodon idella]|uniref:uncharacterized protein LOC127513157 isoform X2 n=1 Tax=Ctenopharyngodon idella TaxID=7959 RepID=UPI00222F4A55|nr:uncharacterized protein LOC127513157 isoform X2 [Ctenopharyngodon idella]